MYGKILWILAGLLMTLSLMGGVVAGVASGMAATSHAPDWARLGLMSLIVVNVFLFSVGIGSLYVAARTGKTDERFAKTAGQSQ